VTDLLTAEDAAWIYTEVLTAFYLSSVGGRLGVWQCLCQIGMCGPCMGGQHNHCTPRLPHWQRYSWPATEVIGSRYGAARTPVLQDAGKPCRWRCPCTCATPETVITPGPAVTSVPEFEQLDLFALAGGGS
jgi:hypothetical protein